MTGVTAGIGRAVALELARRGMTVIGVGRDRQKSQAVETELRQASDGRPSAVLLADLSSMAQVRLLAGQVVERAPQLDVLVNNAGGYYASRRLSPDGTELTLALDLLSPFLLTCLLLEPLRRSAQGRVVNVASATHTRGKVDFGDLEYRRRYPSFGMGAYSSAKLGLVMITYELARRLAGTSVTANALHPGFVASDFAKNNGPLVRLSMTLLRPFAVSVERGAETAVYLAASPEAAGVSGKYFVDKRPVRSAPASYDEPAARRLWEECRRMTGQASPEEPLSGPGVTGAS